MAKAACVARKMVPDPELRADLDHYPPFAGLVPDPEAGLRWVHPARRPETPEGLMTSRRLLVASALTLGLLASRALAATKLTQITF